LIYRAIPKLILIAAVACSALSAQNVSPFIFDAKQSYSRISDNLLKTAEEMPAKYYGFQPTRESPSFGDLLGDVAASQADVCSAVNGKRVLLEGPYSNQKTGLIALLTRSVRTCAAAYSSINSFNASQEIRFEGTQHSLLGLLFLNTSHDNEVYGQLSVYLRLKDLVPPSDKARLTPVIAPAPNAR
jgi:hypothetical protein